VIRTLKHGWSLQPGCSAVADAAEDEALMDFAEIGAVPDWSYALWILAVVTAVAGGMASVSASVMRRPRPDGSHTAKSRQRRSERAYMASYILMSLSIILLVASTFAS
jgi:hypothetical protein